LITEFIDVGWHVIDWSIGRNCALQALKFLQRVGELRQSAGSAFGGDRALRFVLQTLSYRFNRGKFVDHRTPHAGDKICFGFSVARRPMSQVCFAPDVAPGFSGHAHGRARSFRHGEAP